MSDSVSEYCRRLGDISGRWLAVGAVAMLLVAGLGSAVVPLFFGGGGSAYETPSGLYVETSTDHGVGSDNPFNGTDAVLVNNVTISAGGPADLTVDRFEGTWTNVSSVNATQNTIKVDPDDKQSVTLETGDNSSSVAFRDAALDDTVDVVYTASGSLNITVTGLPASTDVTAASAGGTDLGTETTDGSGTATFSLPGGTDTKVLFFENDAPIVDNSSADPPDGGELNSDSTTYSINVSDPTFATTQGDEMNASLYIDGEYRGSDTLLSNGTAELSESGLTGGSHEYYWVVEDNYGETTESQTFNISVPSNIAIRTESEPNDLISGQTNITVRFYREGNETVVERSTDDGTLSLEGLPSAEEYIVTAEHPDYYDRRVVLESLFEQQTIYLLNNTRATADVTFVLQDRTDTFPQSETRLFIEKPINISNTTTFTTISGDSFGASGQYKATLATNGSNRYRLVVRNDDGDVRVLGAYTATVDEAVELEIGRLTYDLGQQGETFKYDAAYTESPQRVRFNYSDADTTEELTLVITNRTSGAEILNKSFTDVSSLGLSDPISGNASERGYVVSFEGTRDGEAVSGQRIVGPRLGPGVNLDDTWRTRFGLAFMLVIGGAFGALRPEIGALAAGTIGGVLWFVGWLPAAVSGGVVVLAVAVAVLLGAKRGGL